jgi:hypothetical protein
MQERLNTRAATKTGLREKTALSFALSLPSSQRVDRSFSQRSSVARSF